MASDFHWIGWLPDRRTWLFAVPSLVLAPLYGIAGIVRPTFVWGGRHYRWDDTFDVTILE